MLLAAKTVKRSRCVSPTCNWTLLNTTLRVRFFGKIRKRICDPRSYGFFDTKETQNPKKDYFAMVRRAGGTQYICQNDISLVLPKNSTRMDYK